MGGDSEPYAVAPQLKPAFPVNAPPGGKPADVARMKLISLRTDNITGEVRGLRAELHERQGLVKTR